METRHVPDLQGPSQRSNRPDPPGTVLSRFTRSASSGSRCRELTSAYSVFCSRTIVSRLSCSSGRMRSVISSLPDNSSRKHLTLWSRCLLWVTPVSNNRPKSDSSSEPSAAPEDVGSAASGGDPESQPPQCDIPEVKSHRRQSAILPASIRSFFFFAAAIARSINRVGDLYAFGVRQRGRISSQ